MQSKQAEAERLRRAKVIDAEGEVQAPEKLLQTGQVLAKAPEAMQLRHLARFSILPRGVQQSILLRDGSKPVSVDLD